MECISGFSEVTFYIFACITFLRVISCNDSYAGGCFSYLSTGLWISVRIYIPKDNFSTTHFMPPAGLEIRPVNDADASTSGQTGRKEAAKERKGVFREIAVASPGCAGPEP